MCFKYRAIIYDKIEFSGKAADVAWMEGHPADRLPDPVLTTDLNKPAATFSKAFGKTLKAFPNQAGQSGVNTGWGLSRPSCEELTRIDRQTPPFESNTELLCVKYKALEDAEIGSGVESLVELIRPSLPARPCIPYASNTVIFRKLPTLNEMVKNIGPRCTQDVPRRLATCTDRFLSFQEVLAPCTLSRKQSLECGCPVP